MDNLTIYKKRYNLLKQQLRKAQTQNELGKMFDLDKKIKTIKNKILSLKNKQGKK